MKYKICVYAICKNEEQFIDRWMDAVSEADMVIVTDTGSTDLTVEKLRSRGAVVYQDTIAPWRFDAARNTALAHIPEDVDICVSNDIDEVFEMGWRDKLENAWTSETTRAKYWFSWSRNIDAGTPEKKFTMEKIHARKGFRWVHPVHEVLEYSGRIPDRSVFIETITLRHLPDPAKSRSQYLPLLELSARENPTDDRTMFWLGREYIFKGMYNKGIATLKKHLEMPSAVWDEERSASMRFIARACRAKGDDKEAERWLFRAVAECPRIREPWLDMTKMGYDRQNWELTFFAAENGLKIITSTNSYLIEPSAWGYSLSDYAAIACYNLGLYLKALKYAGTACRFAPEDKRLKNNYQLILLKCQEAGRWQENESL